MNGINHTHNGPGLLADYLAELLEQFRLFSGPMEPSPGIASQLARIKVAARLLAVLGSSSNRFEDGFPRLGGVLSEWVTFFESSPESFPIHLTFAFERLADFLEELLVRRDQGTSGTALAADGGWPAILAAFRNAGTPLAVLEEVDDLLGRWGRRWSEDNLTPAQAEQLQQRWFAVRSRGDAQFMLEARPASGGRSFVNGGAPDRLALLVVDSSFRRDQIVDILSQLEIRIEIPGDVDRALEFLAAGIRPEVILCDNLEPTRHLARLREGLAGIQDTEDIPLVMIAGNGVAGREGRKKDATRGNAAIWREPFDPWELNRILQRLSHP